MTNEESTSAESNHRPLRFVRLPEVMEKTGLARPTIYKRVAACSFPPPVKVGTASLWIESEVEAWMLARIDSRQKLTEARLA